MPISSFCIFIIYLVMGFECKKNEKNLLSQFFFIPFWKLNGFASILALFWTWKFQVNSFKSNIWLQKWIKRSIMMDLRVEKTIMSLDVYILLFFYPSKKHPQYYPLTIINISSTHFTIITISSRMLVDSNFFHYQKVVVMFLRQFDYFYILIWSSIRHGEIAHSLKHSA